MNESTSKEKILKKIRKSLIYHRSHPEPAIDWEKNIYARPDGSVEEEFANNFTSIGGHFVFCENEMDFLEQLVKLSMDRGWKKIICPEDTVSALLKEIDFPFATEPNNFDEELVVITTCDFLVARLGSIVASSSARSGRRYKGIPTVHVVVAYTSQLVGDLSDVFEKVKNQPRELLPSFLVSIAGPSRTADIEKTLVTPAHGPRDLFVILIDDSTKS